MLEQIKLSVEGNLQHLRENTTVMHDLLINLGLAAVGLAVFWFLSGWLSWIGLVWAILNLAPVVVWVIGV